MAKYLIDSTDIEIEEVSGTENLKFNLASGNSVQTQIGDLSNLTTTDQTDLVSAINEVNENLTNLNTYSTNEKRIGKWVDNKPLYRRVYNTTSFIADTFQTIQTDSSYDIKMVSGFLYRTNNRVDLYGNNVSLVLSIRNTDIEYKTAAAFVTDAVSASFIIEYTKTTD
jgi:CO dehydrogenase/acetyl-CoA synthase epsilon subunit